MTSRENSRIRHFSVGITCFMVTSSVQNTKVQRSLTIFAPQAGFRLENI